MYVLNYLIIFNLSDLELFDHLDIAHYFHIFGNTSIRNLQSL